MHHGSSNKHYHGNDDDVQSIIVVYVMYVGDMYSNKSVIMCFRIAVMINSIKAVIIPYHNASLQ